MQSPVRFHVLLAVACLLIGSAHPGNSETPNAEGQTAAAPGDLYSVGPGPTEDRDVAWSRLIPVAGEKVRLSARIRGPGKHPVDVRFVLATNEPLGELVANDRFREDLYYRINVVSIQMPRLADRLSDIPMLVDTFLEKFAAETGKDRRFSAQAVQLLAQYHWPGNVRELENVVERAVVLSRGPMIDVDDLPEHLRTAGAAPPGGNGRAGGRLAITALEGGWNPMPLSKAMEDPERQIILAALEANSWNRQITARELAINRTTLYKKIKLYRLDQPA